MTLSSQDLSAGSSRFPALEDRVEPGCFFCFISFALLTSPVPTQDLKARLLPACEGTIRRFFVRRLCFFGGGVCRFCIPPSFGNKSFICHSLSLEASHSPCMLPGQSAVRNRCRPTRFVRKPASKNRSPVCCVFSQAPREKSRLRPSALGVLLRLRRLAVSAFRKSFCNERKNISRTFRKRHACGTWERDTLASLRARVTRGQFGQIQTGANRCHSTPTKSS